MSMRIKANSAVEIMSFIESSKENIQTPCYIYSVDQVIKNYNDLKSCLGTPLIVSLKANHCADLLSRAGHEFVDGYEVASLGELKLRAGTKRDVYINSPAYTTKFVEVASRYGAIFIVDHPEQILLIEDVKSRLGFKGKVLLRINLDSFSGVQARKLTDHFGMDEEGLLKAVSLLKSINVNVEGLHIFSGSSNFIKDSARCVTVIECLYEKLCQWLGYKINMVNMGGGIPADWREQDIDFDKYRKSLENLGKKTLIVHESGRAIFSSAGFFVSEILSVKKIQNTFYAICDGGMAQNFMLAKTESIIRKYEAPYVISNGAVTESRHYYFVGSSCNRDDIVGEIKSTDKNIVKGDKVIFDYCGAYNPLYTVSKFLALPEYKEYTI